MIEACQPSETATLVKKQDCRRMADAKIWFDAKTKGWWRRLSSKCGFCYLSLMTAYRKVLIVVFTIPRSYETFSII